MQTSYNLYMTEGLNGQLADGAMNDIINCGSTSAIPFGAPCVRDNSANNKLPQVKVASAAAAGGLFVGLAVRNNIAQVAGVIQANQNAGTAVVDSWTANETYPVNAVIPVLKQGRIYIKCSAVAGANTLGTAKAYFVWATGLYTISNAAVGSSTDCGFLMTSDATGTFTVGNYYVVQVNNQTL